MWEVNLGFKDVAKKTNKRKKDIIGFKEEKKKGQATERRGRCRHCRSQRRRQPKKLGLTGSGLDFSFLLVGFKYAYFIAFVFPLTLFSFI